MGEGQIGQGLRNKEEKEEEEEIRKGTRMNRGRASTSDTGQLACRVKAETDHTT